MHEFRATIQNFSATIIELDAASIMSATAASLFVGC
jgi:hypothetical protein